LSLPSRVVASAPVAEETAASAGGTLDRFFGALARYPTFRRLWFGALGASIGQWMQQVSLGWLALTLTDAPAFVGWVTFAAGLPFLVVAPVGGVLIDRLDRRRLLLVCQVLAALVAVVVASVVVSPTRSGRGTCR